MKELFTLLVDFATPAFDETLRLRDDILRKPLGLEFFPEQIAEEYLDLHLACYNEDFELVGCLVLTPKDDKTIKMRQVVVREDCQRQGVGRRLVEDSELVCQERGFKKMVLNARTTAVPFYLALDYKKSGKPFIEVSIEHYKMSKAL